MGHLIPAGTGFGIHKNIKLVSMEELLPPLPQEAAPAVG